MLEFLVVSLGILGALIVTAAVMDLRAHRAGRSITVDSDAAVDGRRLHGARGDMHDQSPSGGPF